jgi:hypothetical protein
MSNNDMIMYGGIFVVALVVLLYLINWWNDKKASRGKAEIAGSSPTLNLRLQAYERLVLLAERISLPNLVTRVTAGELTVRQMQSVLIDQVKTEFDYNLSQQIYVAPTAWQAVSNLKEQNIYIINQVANSLAPDALNFEAKKIM